MCVRAHIYIMALFSSSPAKTFFLFCFFARLTTMMKKITAMRESTSQHNITPDRIPADDEGFQIYRRIPEQQPGSRWWLQIPWSHGFPVPCSSSPAVCSYILSLVWRAERMYVKMLALWFKGWGKYLHFHLLSTTNALVLSLKVTCQNKWSIFHTQQPVPPKGSPRWGPWGTLVCAQIWMKFVMLIGNDPRMELICDADVASDPGSG